MRKKFSIYSDQAGDKCCQKRVTDLKTKPSSLGFICLSNFMLSEGVQFCYAPRSNLLHSVCFLLLQSVIHIISSLAGNRGPGGLLEAEAIVDDLDSTMMENMSE